MPAAVPEPVQILGPSHGPTASLTGPPACVPGPVTDAVTTSDLLSGRQGTAIMSAARQDGALPITPAGEAKAALASNSNPSPPEAATLATASETAPAAPSQATSGAAPETFAPAAPQQTPAGLAAPALLQSNPAPASQTDPRLAENLGRPVEAAPHNIPQIVAALAKDGARRFEVRLDPAELGRVDVQIEIDRDGQIRTHLIVERPEAVGLLRREAHAMQQAISDSGLRSDGGGVQISLRGGDGQHHTAYRQPQRLQDNDSAGAPDEGTTPIETPRRRLPVMRTGIDLLL